MAQKKAFALRLSEPVMRAMQRWADDDLRSLNAQIEWVLRESLKTKGRLKAPLADPVEDTGGDEQQPGPDGQPADEHE